jgi:Sel1 repeat
LHRSGRIAVVLLIAVSVASMCARAQSGPPQGIPRSLRICERFQAITACGDWTWDGREFATDYRTNVGTGTIQLTGATEISMARVDQKAPFGFKGQQAEYHGTIDGGNAAHGTVKWFIKGRPAWYGTWTATFMNVEKEAAAQSEAQQESGQEPLPSSTPLPPPSPKAPPLPIPVGLEVCDGDCMKGDGNFGTWIFHGMKGGGRWAKGGQVANLTIERFDAGGVVIRREDLPNSSSPGFTAVYEGTIHDSRIEGTATAKWPGHFPKASPPGVARYSWYGTIPVTACDSSAALGAQEAFDAGGKAARFRQTASAFQCFLIAAQQGDGQAKGLVGLMYRDGIGTSVDYKEAFRWLKAGAIQGDYNAQVALEQMYEIGIGISEDPKMAQVWKEKAENNPVILQQRRQAQQQQAAQSMMFMGLAAVLEAATKPDVYVVY